MDWQSFKKQEGNSLEAIGNSKFDKKRIGTLIAATIANEIWETVKKGWRYLSLGSHKIVIR